MKKVLQLPSKKVDSPSLKNEPTNKRKNIDNNSNTTTWDDTFVTISTNLDEATTKKAMTKAVIELRFFFVNF